MDLWTDQCTVKHYEEWSYNEDASRSIRPPKLDDRGLCHLSITLEDRLCQSFSALSKPLTDIVNTFTASHISTNTIQCATTQKLGFEAHIAAKKPYLTQAHGLAQLKWTRDHKRWGGGGLEGWNWVICGDWEEF